MTVVPVCEQCAQPHVTRHGGQACTGHVTHDRDTYVPGQDRQPLAEPRPCKRAPIRGTTVCDSHGAGADQVRRAAEQRVAEEKAEQTMRRFAGPIDTTPTEALLDAVRWTAGYVDWLKHAVENDATDEGAASKLAAWIETLRRLCTDAIRNGIEERRVRFAESQGVLVADVLKGIFGELDLTAAQLELVGEVVPRHLRRLMHVA